MILFSRGSSDMVFSPDEVREALFASLDRLGERRRVLAVPPDFTRYHSQAGRLTELAWEYFGNRLVNILPAIGTHYPMTDEEIETMFGKTPRSLFRIHDWRQGFATLGEVPGELLVLAPGLAQFGEDNNIDRLIRKYGYVGTPRVLDLVRTQEDLQQSLGTAAHLIHGSSEGRFTITYCPGSLSRQEIESVNFQYADLREMLNKYNPGRLKDGFNTLADGEEIFFISNPGQGLWANRERFS